MFNKENDKEKELEKYFEESCNFFIEFDENGNPIYKKKEIK